MLFRSGLIGLLSSLSLVSKLVLVVLLGFSIVSWALILYKWRFFRDQEAADQRFLRVFEKMDDPIEAFRKVDRHRNSAVASVYAEVASAIRLWGMGPSAAAEFLRLLRTLTRSPRSIIWNEFWTMPSRNRSVGTNLSTVSRHDRQHHAVYRLARHSPWDHRCLSGDRYARNREYRSGRAWRRRSARGDGRGPVRGDSRRHGIQLFSGSCAEAGFAEWNGLALTG